MTHNINLSIMMGTHLNVPKPDGWGLIRYREPDIESFIFDHDKGFRFDPTTGLHYDANSRYFINYELETLLRWDPLSNTYRRAGDISLLYPANKRLSYEAFNISPTYHKSKIIYAPSSSQSGSPSRHGFHSKLMHTGKTKRSRRRSTSRDDEPRYRRSRTRSVERWELNKQGWSSSGSKDSEESFFQDLEHSSHLHVRHVAVHYRKRSHSDSSEEPLDESERIERLRRNHGESTSNYSTIPKKCLSSPILIETKFRGTSKRTIVLGQKEQSHDQIVKIEKNEDIWKRLGPSIKNECSESMKPSDSENGTSARVKGRTVRLIRALSAEEAPPNVEVTPNSKQLGSKDVSLTNSQPKTLRKSSKLASSNMGENLKIAEVDKVPNKLSKEGKLKKKYPSIKKLKEEVLSDDSSLEKKCLPVQPHPSARQKVNSGRKYVDRNCGKYIKSSKNHQDASSRSRSREPRLDPHWRSQRCSSGARERKRSHSSTTDLSLSFTGRACNKYARRSRGSKISGFREASRSLSRERWKALPLQSRRRLSRGRRSSRSLSREKRRSLGQGRDRSQSWGRERSSNRGRSRSPSGGRRSPGLTSCTSRSGRRRISRDRSLSWGRDRNSSRGRSRKSPGLTCRRSQSRGRRSSSHGRERSLSRGRSRSLSRGRRIYIARSRSLSRGRRTDLDLERSNHRMNRKDLNDYYLDDVSLSSLSSSDDKLNQCANQVSQRSGTSVTRMSCERELEKQINSSPSCLKIEPISNSSVHKEDIQIQTRESMEANYELHEQVPLDTKIKLEHKDAAFISHSKVEKLGDSQPNTSSKDSAFKCHQSVNQAPDDEVHKVKEVTLNEIHAVGATHTQCAPVMPKDNVVISEVALEKSSQIATITIDSEDESAEVVDLIDDDSLKTETVIDDGDVLGHLFTNDNHALTNILLIAPVPLHSHSKCTSDALKSQIGDPEGLNKVYFNHESKSGSPCHFIVASFKSANAAKKWYDSQSGTITLSGDHKVKGYMHFLKKGNWNCKHCKSFNFFMQSVCPRCFRAKENGFSPVSVSEEPSSLVGIAKLKSGCSTVEHVTESLPPLQDFNILTTEMVKEPCGLSLGLCVFEVESNEEGNALREFLLQLGRNAVYLVENERPKTPDEEYLSRMFEKVTPDNIVLAASTSTTPDRLQLLASLKSHLVTLLKEDDVKYNKITLHVGENVGAPTSYALVTFDNKETAVKWMKSYRRKLNYSGQESPSVSLYFSKENWKCLGCLTKNFPLRTLCHRCFNHKEPNKLSPIAQSLAAARWVAIPGMFSWSKNDENIVQEFRELLKEFILKKVEVIRDSECQPLPLACVIEMQGEAESLRLREYLANEGKFSQFVILNKELDEPVLTNAPDVMIVEELPECIDLTGEGDRGVLEDRPAGCIDLTENGVELTTSQNETVQPSNVDLVMEKSPTTEVPTGVTEITEKAINFPEISPTAVISVGPVPRLGGNTQWLCAVAFLEYGAEYSSVEYCQGNLFGVSYNYCLLYFTSPESAMEWYNNCKGFIKITNKTFPSKNKSKRPSKAFLHFTGKNWLCDCGKENCHVRSMCYNCFKEKDKQVPIFSQCQTPTKYLAIKSFKRYTEVELAAIFPMNRCMTTDVMSIKFICDPNVQKDNFGIYIVETKYLEGAIALRNYYKQSLVVQSTGYVVLNDHSAGSFIYSSSSLAPLGSKDNGYGVANDKPLPDYAAIIWTSLYGVNLDVPPTNIVMISLCLEYQELPETTNALVMKSFKESGVTPASVAFSYKRDVGSPFSYCLVSFDSPDDGKKWFDKCEDAFQFEISRPDDQKLPSSFQNCFSQKNAPGWGPLYFFKSKLHYSQPNWTCNCGTPNFPLRSVCHACFKNKNKESGYSVSDATKFVGIKLTECLETVDTSALYNVRKYGYNVTKINIGLDPAIPRDPYGIIIFEMPSRNEGIQFRRFLSDLNNSQESGYQIYDPTIKKLIGILTTSSGITFLIPYQK